MKITDLQIENFRGVRSVHLANMDNMPRMFISGGNGTGKTTILQAIRAVLFGRLIVNGERIQVSEWLGPFGKKGMIRLTIAHESKTFTCSLKLNAQSTTLKICDWTGTTQQQRLRLWEELEVKPEDAEICMDPATYLCSNNLGKLLAESADSGVDQERLAELCGDHWDDVKEAIAALKLDSSIMVDLEKFGQTAYNKRTEANKAVNLQKSKLAQMPDPELPVDRDGNKLLPDALPALRGHMQSMAAQQREIIDSAEQSDTPTYSQSDIDNAQKFVDTMQKKQKDLKAKRAELDNESSTCSEQVTVWIQKSAEARGKLQVFNSSMEKLEKVVQSFDGGACPTCTQAVSAELVEQIKKNLSDEYFGDADNSGKLEEEINNAEKTAEEWRKKNDDIKAQLRESEGEYNTALRQLQEAEGNYTSMANSINRVEHDEDLPDINVLNERIEAGRAKIAALEQTQERSDAVLERDRLEQGVIKLDWMVEAFKHGAVLRELAAKEQNQLIDRSNAVLDSWGAGKLACTQEGSLMLNSVPVARVSDGERRMCELAMGLGYSEGTIPILLDGCEVLDAVNKATLVELLQKVETPQVIFSAAWSLSDPPADLDGLCQAMSATICWRGGI